MWLFGGLVGKPYPALAFSPQENVRTIHSCPRKIVRTTESSYIIHHPNLTSVTGV